MKAKDSVRVLCDESDTADTIDEQTVIDYLKSNPDFFRHHQELLCDLQIPHGSSAAVSLVERQVALLRERNIDMRHRLGRIVETARGNDHLFDKTRQLVLQLLELHGVDELLDHAQSQLRRELGADFCQLLLTDSDVMQAVDTTQAEQALPAVFQHRQTLCGNLREAERRFLFGADANAVESAAVVPLQRDDRIYGALAVGSSDATYFNPDMGTLFLEFVADVIVRRIPVRHGN